jgi:hypothetical protein
VPRLRAATSEARADSSARWPRAELRIESDLGEMLNCRIAELDVDALGAKPPPHAVEPESGDLRELILRPARGRR